MARIACFFVAIIMSTLFGLGIASANCGSQMPGAQEGRPPNAAEILNAWPWTEPTCWFQWRERGATRQRRDQMRAECLAGAGRDYLHFQEDHGATGDGSNTCIFRLAGPASTPPRVEAPKPAPAPTQPAGRVEPDQQRLAQIKSMVERGDTAVRAGRLRDAVPLYHQAIDAYREICCYGELRAPWIRPGGEAIAKLALEITARAFDAECRADIDEMRRDPMLPWLAERNFGVVGERCARHPALAELRELARQKQSPTRSRPTSRDGSRPGKCPDGNDARRCVTLEQRGRTGRWHNFRLVNGCNQAFSVNVFHCYAEWAGGCKVEKIRVAACETTGSASEGNQSWDRDAEIRW